MMIDKDAYKKLRENLWDHAGEAAREGNAEREAVFLRAFLLIELAAGNIKEE
jgi:hypothetical protein